ncbi:choice-of-anchor Q domain-containing protein [Emticicia sp. SJ17W-69]|uniref:choice-of-anchor Q domain-containing protein n=1 Tax=Emticicia sp. SJ17W-69 TaxID=3421657 RepID=UPI003EBCA4B6
MNSLSIFRKTSIFILFALIQTSFAQIYVKVDANGLNNGTSWENAFKNLSDALDLARTSNQQIWVAQGVYFPDRDPFGGRPFPGTTVPYRDMTFYISGTMQLYGGFLGNETLLNQRNPNLFKTILSGDIDNNDINNDGNYIAETTANLVGENAYHVVLASNCVTGSLMDGFIITSGMGNTDPNIPNQYFGVRKHIGAGAVVNVSNIQLSNNLFIGNKSSYGGALAVFENYSNLELFEVKLLKNTFLNNEAKLAGGSIYTNYSEGGLVMNECVFSNNKAQNGGAFYSEDCYNIKINNSSFIENKSINSSGGGLVVVRAQTLQIDSCLFDNNEAINGGHAISILIVSNPLNSFIDHCTIKNHLSTVTQGFSPAALYIFNATMAVKNTFLINNLTGATITSNSNIKFYNCVLGGNEKGNVAISDSECEIVHSTIAGVQSSSSCFGVYLQGSPLTTIKNSIIWGYSENNSFIKTSGSNIYQISNSIIQKSQYLSGSGYTNNNPLFYNLNDFDGEDNILGTEDDGLSLDSCSLGINTGAFLPTTNTDIAGNVRPYNGGIPDIGAYEYQKLIPMSKTRLYVNKSAGGLNKGNSWTNAFTSLEDALTRARNCYQVGEIWVTSDVYYPEKDGLGNSNPTDVRTKTFLVRDNIKLYGGFSGNELSITERIIGNPKTILSGDIDNNDINTDTNFIIEDVSQIQGNNSLNVLSAVNDTLGIEIDNFVLTGGQADKNILTSVGTSFILHNQGGGIFLGKSKAKLSNMSIIGNKSLNGGGLSSYQSKTNIYNSVFEKNVAQTNGGGVSALLNSIELVGVIFQENSSGEYGGGAYFDNLDSSKVINTVVYGSYSKYGGGMMFKNIPELKIYNTNIVNNSNLQGYSGDGVYFWNAQGEVRNSIFYGNSGNEGGYFLDGGNIAFSNSIFQNGILPSQSNNFSHNPLFLNQSLPKGVDGKFFTNDDGLNITQCSKAINAGINSPLVLSDILGNNRRFDIQTDIGAYESLFYTHPQLINNPLQLVGNIIYNPNQISINIGQPSQSLILKSALAIELKPGFMTSFGKKFEAIIGGCN